jgi:Xaa-Pro aminopeptidase
MREKNVDYMFLTPEKEMYYLSGFEKEIHERHFFLVVSLEEQPFFFVPEVYREQLEQNTWIQNFEPWNDTQDPKTQLQTLLDQRADRKILFSAEMDAKFVLDIIDIFPEADYGNADEILEELRIKKDGREIEKIRESSRIADEVVQELRQMGEEIVGQTEDRLAEIINDKMFEKGGEETSFNTTASSGPNGSKPHYNHGEKVIEKGEPVVLDFGCYKDHYPSDQTRTIVFGGEPSEKFKEVHQIVKKAQQKAFEKVQPGVEAREVDDAARKVIEDAGYGEEFIHRTGHGVGLDVHEPPFINQVNDRELKEAMVFSIEPGIYIEGEFGVRIEDLVAVTEDGGERLNKTERGWS